MRRPFGVTILLWLVLSLTAWSGLRLYSAIQWWKTLSEFASPPGPFYIAASAGIWLVAGLLLLWGMWWTKPWTRFALLGAGVAYTAWYWSDRFIFKLSGLNWRFVLAMNILLLVILVICVMVPGTRTFFSKREAHE